MPASGVAQSLRLSQISFAALKHPTDEAIDIHLGPLVSSLYRKSQSNAYAIGLYPNPLAGIEAALKKSVVPTQIVWGTADSIFSQVSPYYVDHVFRNSLGVRRVEGAKLFFPEEMPELIAAEALQLWDL